MAPRRSVENHPTDGHYVDTLTNWQGQHLSSATRRLSVKCLSAKRYSTERRGAVSVTSSRQEMQFFFSLSSVSLTAALFPSFRQLISFLPAPPSVAAALVAATVKNSLQGRHLWPVL